MIVITAVIAFALVSVFPFLAPVAFILMLVIFFMRLGYIVNNWRAVLTGFYMYGIAVGFALWHWPFMSEALAAGIAAAVTLLFHLLMLWLYRHGYTMQRAMPIMELLPTAGRMQQLMRLTYIIRMIITVPVPMEWYSTSAATPRPTQMVLSTIIFQRMANRSRTRQHHLLQAPTLSFIPRHLPAAPLPMPLLVLTPGERRRKGKNSQITE